MEYSKEHNNKINELFKIYWPEIYKFVYYKVQNKEESEELTQDVFARVYPKLRDGLIEDSKCRYYLYTTARNIINDLWRSRGRKPQIINIEDQDDREISIPNKGSEVEDKMVIEEAIAQLTKDFRKVLELRIINGYSINETAKKMRRSEGAVKSLQYRAVQSLKNILTRGGYFHEQTQ